MSDEKKVFKGIPLISAKLEGDVLHIRNDGDAPALVRGAVFGHVDEAGNFVAQEHAIHSIAIGNGRDGASVCAVCQQPFYSRDDHPVCGGCRGLGSPPAFELQLDPWERIEKAAAEWRNAYRAHERGDQSAVMRHSSLAVAHTVELSRGLR